MTIPLSPFQAFTKEQSIVGRLLSSYTYIEVSLMFCVWGVRDDFDTTLKVMFRTRGETQRIDVADALGRQFYKDHNLKNEFSMAIGSMRHCLKIRNQYSHCIWWDDNSGKLAFANMEDIAKSNEHVSNLTDLKRRHVDPLLLVLQEDYFKYTDELLNWINFEGRLRANRIPSHAIPNPKQRKQPPLQL